MGVTAAVGESHHELALHELFLLLQSDPRGGLEEQEAARRLEAYGPNQLTSAPSDGALRRFVRQLHSPLVYVLITAGMVTLFLGEFVDTAVIFGVVAVNAIIGFIQESKADSALDALRSMVVTDAQVIRGGQRRQIRSEQLVPGDLIVVETGDKIPADLRLVAETELQVDESALTGESLPVAKDLVVLPSATAVADRRNMAYSGTLVTGGGGRGIIVATGDGTELGEIHRLVGSAKPLATPLTRKLATFSSWLTAVILALAAVTFVVGVIQGKDAAEMFTAAVALAVGAIPEGLPAAVTITLAIGVSRMARRKAVIRRLPAVETLGGATVVCSDKTGTLTQNRMTVQAVWTPTQEVVATKTEGVGASPAEVMSDEATRWCLQVGANCNDSRLTSTGKDLGDPTETAMLRVAQRYGIVPHALRRVDTLPFSSELQYMATQQLDPDTGQELVMVKGAVERVLDLCSHQMKRDGSTSPLDRGLVLDAAERLAARGMRVLAAAVDRNPDPATFERLAGGRDQSLTLTGLQAMLDPPRETALAAVTTCRTAGLQVKMITGDHAATARSIAAQVGILDDERGRVLSGADLDLIEDDDLPEAAESVSVFARVNPRQKLRLVRALQARQQIVAMTGDGVNDAPALRQADIGVAMGLGGTEVAKDAGDMVLTDDDFATIEAAVEEGRGVFDNLTKFIVWTLPTNMGEGMVILVAIILGTTLPILPTQILWINMTSAVALGLMLAWEPKEAGIMERPPRDPTKSLLTGPVVFRTLLVSALLVIGTWWLFTYESSHGASVEASRTAAINLFVTVEAFYLFSCRSLNRSVWHTGWFTNTWLLVGVGVQALGQAALTYLPVMNTLFHTAPIGWQTWLRILLVASVAALVVALDKRRLSGRAL